jgi:hypothetical protein
MTSSGVDIFSSAKPQGGEFAKFANVGDSVQGTYIDVRTGIDGFGNNQTIYVLSDTAGKIWNVGFRDSNAVVLERMKGVRFGQIVGFRYDELRPSKVPGRQAAKIIRVYADPKQVDAEWLKQQAVIEARYASSPAAAIVPIEQQDEFSEEHFPTTTVPANVSPAGGALPTAEVGATPAAAADPKSAIRNLAITKGLANDMMTGAEVDAAVEAYTGLPLVEANFTQTIIKLASYSAQ